MQPSSVVVLLTMRTSLTPMTPESVISSTKTSSRQGAPTTIVRASTIFRPWDEANVSSDDRTDPVTVDESLDAERGVIARSLREKTLDRATAADRDGPQPQTWTVSGDATASGA